MAVRVNSVDLDLTALIKPGDAIVWGQACGEPLTLIEVLLKQRAALSGISAFAGSSFSGTLKAEHADHIAFRSMGSIGTLRSLAKVGALGVVPCHVGQIGNMIRDGAIQCDIAFVQASPPDEDGRYSYGVINDYIRAAVQKARLVIAEVNAQVPFVRCDNYLLEDEIDIIVETDRNVVTVPRASIDEISHAIARLAANYIGDDCILQFGIGTVPDAILQTLADRRDLGIHTGMIGDAVIDLIDQGIITNATKPEWRGISVTGALIGSRRLYNFAHKNNALLLASSSITHGDAILCRLPRLVSINSALEVDLTGQINAEVIGGNYMGATGGQIDYVRAGARSPGGRSIIALPATAQGNAATRIVARLSGPVTTARSEVDVIVTEFGAAELKGCTLAERARQLINIAHPDFREPLERAAHGLLSRGI